jgi:hypothetical protein
MSYDLPEKIDTILGEIEQLKKKQEKILYMCDHMSRIMDAWVRGRLGDDNPLDFKMANSIGKDGNG